MAWSAGGVRELSLLRLAILRQRMAPLLWGRLGVPVHEDRTAAGGYRCADLLAVLKLERCHFLAADLVGFVDRGILVHVSERQGLLAAEALLALFVELRLSFT